MFAQTFQECSINVIVPTGTHPLSFIRQAGCHTNLGFLWRCQLLLHAIRCAPCGINRNGFVIKDQIGIWVKIDWENLKPLLSAQSSILFRCSWSCLFMACMCFGQYETRESSKNRDLSTPFLIQMVRLLILTINRVTDKMLPCRTPISWS